MYLAGMTWYSQSAFRFGDYVMKCSLCPSAETMEKLKAFHGRVRKQREGKGSNSSRRRLRTAEEKEEEKEIDPDPDPSGVLHRWLQDLHAQHDAEFVFRMQMLETLDEQPVEYAGSARDEDKYPWQPVARLVVPRQDSWSPARKSFWEDHLRVNPCHGLEKLRPLGSANLRKRLWVLKPPPSSSDPSSLSFPLDRICLERLVPKQGEMEETRYVNVSVFVQYTQRAVTLGG
ncbi:hypothetical protein F5Y19DRAFT_469254 [Xylariaceae sp. FL1651]|nr:hypothetical protein F5Y19DRAFT_469254 [Xylariaceae sp. FL1651]